MNRDFFFLVVPVAFILVMLPGRADADPVPTTLSVSSLGTVAQGSTFDVEVDISGAADLYAYQLDLDFNPSVLQATGTITEGSFFQSGGGFVPGSVDNTAGTITFNADTLLGPGPGLNGGGQLIVFEFDALAAGTSGLDLANVTLLDSSLNNIDFTSTNGFVIVTGTAPAPEPATLFLLGSALGSLALFAAFKKT